MVNQIAPVSGSELSKVSYLLGNNKMDVTGCNSLLVAFFPPAGGCGGPATTAEA